MSTEITPELREDEWIVVFYQRTGALRLYPSLHAAQQSIAKPNWSVHLYKSPQEFRTRHDHFALERLWKVAHSRAKDYLPKYSIGRANNVELDQYETPPDLPTEAFCQEFWNFLQMVGDRVSRLSIQNIRSKEHYEVKKADILALMADEEAFKDAYPKQARIILDALVRQESPYILENDLGVMMRQLVIQGKLKTKQDSWRIFQYYRPQFIDNKLLVRGDVKKGGDEEDDYYEAA